MNDHASREAKPTLADVAVEFPHWHCWQGIGGLVYARRMNTSPPPVLRAEDAGGLAGQIKSWEAAHER